jgi:hypothetical protein
MHPVSRFGSGKRASKKQSVGDKLLKFFEKYFELVSDQQSLVSLIFQKRPPIGFSKKSLSCSAELFGKKQLISAYRKL